MGKVNNKTVDRGCLFLFSHPSSINCATLQSTKATLSVKTTTSGSKISSRRSWRREDAFPDAKVQHFILAMALYGSLRLSFQLASEQGKGVQTEWGKQMATEWGKQMTTGLGIQLATGSGIQLGCGSGIQLESASGIQLGSGSGNLFTPFHVY